MRMSLPFWITTVRKAEPSSSLTQPDIDGPDARDLAHFAVGGAAPDQRAVVDDDVHDRVDLAGAILRFRKDEPRQERRPRTPRGVHGRRRPCAPGRFAASAASITALSCAPTSGAIPERARPTCRRGRSTNGTRARRCCRFARASGSSTAARAATHASRKVRQSATRSLQEMRLRLGIALRRTRNELRFRPRTIAPRRTARSVAGNDSSRVAVPIAPAPRCDSRRATRDHRSSRVVDRQARFRNTLRHLAQHPVDHPTDRTELIEESRRAASAIKSEASSSSAAEFKVVRAVSSEANMCSYCSRGVRQEEAKRADF